MLLAAGSTTYTIRETEAQKYLFFLAPLVDKLTEVLAFFFLECFEPSKERR
jgi:hypothetical protein